MANPKRSAGIMVWRRPSDPADAIEILLVHPGGPFWANKDEHGWSIPKGEYELGEDPGLAARREFTEELGQPVPDGELADLGELKTSSKIIRAFAIEGNLDPTLGSSNTFEMEWPPRSGRTQSFPEVDKAEWFSVDLASTKLHKGQIPLVARLVALVGESRGEKGGS